MSIETSKEKTKSLDHLLGPMDPVLDRQMREKLVTARVGLLLHNSFFGNLATRLKLVNSDEWCTTAATDGRNFYYNSRFIEMLRQKEVEFLFGHEVLHVVYDHFDRRGNERDPRLWNVAADFAVNADLKDHKVGEFITTVDALYDPKHKGKPTEEIYDELYENAEKIDIDDLVNKILDEHLDDMDGAGGSGDADGKEDDKKGNGRPQLTEEERDKIKDEIKEAVLNAASTSDPGKIPAGVKRIVQQLTEPKMDFRDVIQTQIQSTIKNDFTFTRVSRKGWHHEAVLPGMLNEDMIDIAVGLDLSGSINNEQARDFLSEVQGITEQFQSFRIHLFTFDTQVYNYKVFESDGVEEIGEYELIGGGGTEYEMIFDFLKENEIEPQKLLVFTDGYPWSGWGDPNYCDTVWVIHSNPAPNPPFGIWVPYEEAA